MPEDPRFSTEALKKRFEAVYGPGPGKIRVASAPGRANLAYLESFSHAVVLFEARPFRAPRTRVSW